MFQTANCMFPLPNQPTQAIYPTKTGKNSANCWHFQHSSRDFAALNERSPSQGNKGTVMFFCEADPNPHAVHGKRGKKKTHPSLAGYLKTKVCVFKVLETGGVSIGIFEVYVTELPMKEFHDSYYREWKEKPSFLAHLHSQRRKQSQ